MQQDLFEYAIIRVVPRVEREEFINIGVIMFCAKQKFLHVKYIINENKLKTFSSNLDFIELHDHICSIERICQGKAEAGPIGKLDIASRFRWLTATRSTVVQTSKVHPGFCADASETLEKMFLQMVN
jgi:hypothetical protein